MLIQTIRIITTPTLKGSMAMIIMKRHPLVILTISMNIPMRQQSTNILQNTICFIHAIL